MKTKWNTENTQLNGNLSQGLVALACNLSYSADSGSTFTLPKTSSTYLPCACCWETVRWHFFGNVHIFSLVWESPGHLLHSSFQSLCISPAWTSCVLAYLNLPTLTDLMNFFSGILSLEFSEQTCPPIFKGSIQEGHSAYDERQALGP
jgi:hypothetical protein